MPLREGDENRFVHKSGGGFLILFGLTFFLVGIGIILGNLFGTDIIEKDPAKLFFLVPFGLIFASVGLVFIVGRYGFEIDKSSDEITEWWGIPKPVKSKTYPLAAAKEVRIEREVRRSKNSTFILYPVRLVIEGHKTITLESPKVFKKARQIGENLASFTRLPLTDASSEIPETRGYEELDLNVKERFQRGSMVNDIPEVPPKLRSQIEFDGQSLKVTLPPAGAQLALLLVLGGILFFCGVFVFVFLLPMLEGSKSSSPPNFILLIFSAVFFLVPGSVAARLLITMFLERQTLTADRTCVSHTRGWILRRTTSIPADSIEEIFLGSATGPRQTAPVKIGIGKAIVVRSDDYAIRAGAYLSTEENQYILALLKAVVVS